MCQSIASSRCSSSATRPTASGSSLRHGNEMADRLAAGLAAADLTPVEANEVFVALPGPIDARLKQQGASYHP
jgi:threonine aldolase